MKGGLPMRPFCKIGKAVLTRALGLQKNYTEVIENSYEITDIAASGCESCRWYSIRSVTKPGEELYAECENACATCPHRQMKMEHTYKKVYHNEFNRYGYQPRLKTNAIKLLIAYHFFDIDSIGIIRNIDLQELADKLGCNIKTINNNNELLKEYGYIAYSKVDTGLVNVFLPGYEDYFKPASAGGRGFLNMSETVFDEILKIDSINVLRLALRELMEFDLISHKTDSTEKSYKELKRMLPDYCKRNIIQKASGKLSMFVTEVKDKIIRFIIKPEYDTKRRQEEYLHFYEEEIFKLGAGLSHDALELNTGIHNSKDSAYAGFFDGAGTDSGDYVGWFFNQQEIDDLAMLCLQYSFGLVTKALQSIYKTYKSRHLPIQNLGGLTRTVITAMF